MLELKYGSPCLSMFNAAIPVVPPTTTAQMQRLLVVKGRAIAVKTKKHNEGMSMLADAIEPPEEPISGEVSLDVIIVHPYLKSDTARVADRDRRDFIRSTSKPDGDNWVKGFQDMLVSHKVLKNDQQVCDLRFRKFRGHDDHVGVYVIIKDLSGTPADVLPWGEQV